MHDDDLPEFLEAIGIAGAFKDGRLTCKFCKQVVTAENLHAIFPEAGDVKVICDTPACVTYFLAYRQDKMRTMPHG